MARALRRLLRLLLALGERPQPREAGGGALRVGRPAREAWSARPKLSWELRRGTEQLAALRRGRGAPREARPAAEGGGGRGGARDEAPTSRCLPASFSPAPPREGKKGGRGETGGGSVVGSP